MKTTFQNDVRDLFRQKDRDAMLSTRHALDLWDHAQVSDWADRILMRVEDGVMPCDQAWDSDKVAVFKKWISDGKLL